MLSDKMFGTFQRIGLTQDTDDIGDNSRGHKENRDNNKNKENNEYVRIAGIPRRELEVGCITATPCEPDI